MRSMVLVMTMVLVSGILSVWKGYIGLITWVNAKTGNHDLWVKCTTSAECLKLIYQPCSRL